MLYLGLATLLAVLLIIGILWTTVWPYRHFLFQGGGLILMDAWDEEDPV